MFLKNFNFFKKRNKNNLLFVDYFNKFYFYYFYNLFNFFYFSIYFYNNNIVNYLNKKYFNFSNLIKIFSSEDDFRKKKNFLKIYNYKNSLTNVFYNQFFFNHTFFKKFSFFKKYTFFRKNILFFGKSIFKNKLKNYSFSFKEFKFNYLNIDFLNFYINIFLKFLLKWKFFKHNFYTHKNIYLYKNFFKNFYIFKNLNQFFLNKNFFLLNSNLINNSKINFYFLKNFNYVYNNQYPLIFFKKFNKNIFSKFNLKKKNNFLNLFNLYILNFFEFFFKKNFFFKISNKIQFNHNKKISFFLQNYSNNNIKFQKFFDLNEMIELFCIAFIQKDLVLIKNWIIFTLNNISVKNHKKLFVIINDFVVENFPLLSYLFNIKGFYFCVKGKIGLSGNAKKKKFFFKKGLLKVSSKNFKIDNQRFFIKTNCGSLGINIILTY